MDMSIQPKGENFRKAFKWVSEECKYNPAKKLRTLVEEASLKFNLSPKDADFLIRKLCDEK